MCSLSTLSILLSRIILIQRQPIREPRNPLGWPLIPPKLLLKSPLATPNIKDPTTRHENLHDRPGRNPDLDLQRPLHDLPLDTDPSVDSNMLDTRPRDFTPWHRRNAAPRPAWLETFQPPDPFVDELPHRTVRIMVKARHLAGVDTPIRPHRIPPLPSRRRPHGDLPTRQHLHSRLIATSKTHRIKP